MRLLPLLLAYAILFFPTIAESSEYTAPKLVQNNNPIVREFFNSRNGLEGWVWLNFEIDATGEIKNPLILDHSGEADFIAETLRYIRRVEYSPGTINGKAVNGHAYFFMTHTISTGPDLNLVVGESFNEAMAETMRAIIANDKDKSTELLEELEDDTLNLAKQAWLAWTKSMYYYRFSDFDAYHRETWVAAKLSEDYLSAKVTSKVLSNLFQSQLHRSMVFDAISTIYQMEASEKVNISPDIAEEFYQATLNHTQQAPSFEQQRTLTESFFYRNLMEDKLTLSVVSGSISKWELRCLGHREESSEKLQSDSKPVVLTNNFPDCALFVKGEAGSEILLKGVWSNDTKS